MSHLFLILLALFCALFIAARAIWLAWSTRRDVHLLGPVERDVKLAKALQTSNAWQRDERT